MKKSLLLIATVAALLTGCGSESRTPSDATKENVTAALASSADDQKAESLLKEAYALIEQKKAPEAEAKLAEVIALKPLLSEKVRAQVGAAIAGLSFIDGGRAVKLGQQWEKP